MRHMRHIAILFLCSVPVFAQQGWVQLFNGKDFSGWQVNENKDTFSIEDGAIKAHGTRSHCFYTGDFKGHMFKDFELEVEVKTLPGSNGGIYIDTEFQAEGWPAKGFEVQVNNTYVTDPVKTGSLYHVKDNGSAVAGDNEWFTERIIQRGDSITIQVNG